MMNELRRRPRIAAVALLLVAAMAWGSTFVIVKHAVSQAPVLDFLTWRFLLAGAILVVWRPRALSRLGWRGVCQGGALGLVLAAGYLLQTYGLEITPAAVSGFLTGLQVAFTPLIAWALLRHRPRGRTWAAILVATGGLALITLRGISLGPGEVLTLGSAAAFALQLVGLGRWTSIEDAYGLATMQLLTVGVVCTVGAAPSGIGLPSSPGVWGAVALTAVAATAFAFAAQTWAQSHLSATAAAVVFTTEPVFAALFAGLAGEHFGWTVLAGGGLVVAAMLVLGVTSGRDVTGRPAEMAAGMVAPPTPTSPARCDATRAEPGSELTQARRNAGGAFREG
ncbi:MAG: DMT family transporter [Acidimicrobiales bacterium]